MYSRYNTRPGRPVRLPENYSGCAFAPTDEPPTREKREHEHEIGARMPSPTPIPSRPTPLPLPPPAEHPLTPPPIPAPPLREEARESHDLLGGIANAFPFAHGLGSEELLLIALIVLLSHCERDRDMVLWLAVLLFCG